MNVKLENQVTTADSLISTQPCLHFCTVKCVIMYGKMWCTISISLKFSSSIEEKEWDLSMPFSCKSHSLLVVSVIVVGCPDQKFEISLFSSKSNSTFTNVHYSACLSVHNQNSLKLQIIILHHSWFFIQPSFILWLLSYSACFFSIENFPYKIN